MLLLQKPAAPDDRKELEEAISHSSDTMKKMLEVIKLVRVLI
jgi:hypothetical protein